MEKFDDLKIAVLIPCYNEESTIGKVVTDFKKELPNADIYVYDNNSTDKTVENAKESGAIIGYEKKQGKGNVIKTMFKQIDADIYVMVDGDDTYPAESVREMINSVVNDGYDMVTGDRISNGTYHKQVKNKVHEFGNLLVRKMINLLFNQNLKDILTGYRVFNRTFVKNMPIMHENFELETEMTLFASDKGYKIKEIPINFRERIDGKSKVRTVNDGIKVISIIIKMFKNYKPFTFFTIIFLVLFLTGILIGLPVIIEFAKYHYISKIPSAVLATGFVILSVISEQCGIILHTITKQNKENYEINLIHYVENNDKKKL